MHGECELSDMQELFELCSLQGRWIVRGVLGIDVDGDAGHIAMAVNALTRARAAGR